MRSGPPTASPAKPASFRVRQMRMLALQLFIGIAVAALPLALTTDASAARSVHYKKKPGVARTAPKTPRAAHRHKKSSLHKPKSGKFHQPKKPKHSPCCTKLTKTKPPYVIHKPAGVIVRTPPVTIVAPVVSVRMPPGPAPSAVSPGRPPPRQPAPLPPSLRGGNRGVPAAGETRYVPDEIVLEIDPRLSSRAIEALARRHSLAPLESRRFQLANTVVYRWRVLRGRSVPAAIRALEADRQVRSAQPNYLFALSEEALASPSRSQGPATTAGDPAQYSLGKLRLPEAHAHAKGAGVIVAVIDSSIDVSHPELKGAIAGRFDALRATEIPDAHGTGIAGAISARARLLGVAPAARILAVRAFGGGNSTTFSIMSGIDWAATNGARVLNMSFVGPRDPLIGRELAAAYRKGIVLVAASGNAGPNSPPLYPAAEPGVIAVTATDAEDNLFAASNRGSHIAVAAPGTNILHAAPNGTYRMSSGTSLAAAHVSGIVALLLERQPNLTPDSVRNILFTTAVDLGPQGRDDQFGAGRADAYRAVSAIQRNAASLAGARSPR